MLTTSRVSPKKSWQTGRQHVSVLAEMALRREKIVQRLTELREKNSLSQEHAAAKVGVTLRQWQRWEAGQSVPYPRNMDAIASAFGISVQDFFDADPDATTVQLLEARVIELEDQVTELRAGLLALTADSLRHAQGQSKKRGKGQPPAPEANGQ